jgi:hypothetical protein
VEHKESIGHSPVNMWKMKLKSLRGREMTTEMLGHAVPMFITAFLTVEKAKARAKCLNTLYKEEKCGIHVVSKLIVKIKP